jgi:hypothetical protein
MAERAPWETEAPEQAPWETEAPLPQRGVLQRAGEEAAETFKGGVEAAKGLVTPLPKVEGESAPGRLWRAAKTTAAGLMSPLTTTVGPVASAAESLLASGLGAVTFADPAKQKLVKPGSEEAYQAARPYAGAAVAAVRPAAPGPTGPRLPNLSRVERGAAGQIEQHATDLPEVQRRLTTSEELVPGSEPTTFQTTGDPGLGQLERTSRLTSPAPFVERAAEQNAARIRALEGTQPTGAPADVATHLRDALRAEQEVAERNVKAAHQRAWDASQQPGGTYDPATYGNVFRQELQQAEDAARANERGLWRAVDPNGVLRVNPQPMQELERSIYGSMTEAGAASLTPAETQISNLISGYVPQGIPFRELTDLRSLTSTALREELVTRGRTPAYARLSQLRQGIEDALERSVSMPIPGGGTVDVGDVAAQRVREASAATAQRAQTFRPLRDITRREGAAGPYRMGESQVAGRIVQPGPKGYDSASNYLRAVGNERGLPDVQDAVAASMRRETIGTDGVVNQRKLEGWLKRHQDVLRAIDERDGGAFSQTLRNAGTAQEALEAAEANRAEVAARYGKEEMGRLIGAQDDAEVSAIIGNLFGKVDSVKRVRELMGKLTTPAAQAGARRAVLDHIQQRFLGTQQLGEDAILRGGRFVEFVRNNAAALRQVLSLDQFNSLQMIAKDLLRTSQSATGKAIPGGSDTAQNVTGLLQRVGSLFGKAGIDTVAANIPGGALVVRGIEAGVGFGRAKRAAKIQSLVDQAMLEPKVAQDLLRRNAARKAGKPTPPFARSATGAALEAGALSERDRKRKQGRLPRQTGGYVPLAGLARARPAGTQAPDSVRPIRARPSEALPHGRAARFQAGGATSEYDTPLKPGEEAAFQFWKGKYAPNDTGEDYDLRGAWKAGVKPDPVTKHWPDTYKKPNHPTFSDQSQYAKDRPDLAGHWEGPEGPDQTYVPPPGRQEGGEVEEPPAEASRAQEKPPEPWIDPMSGAPANEESLRTIGRGAYNIAHGLLVDLPKRFIEETPRVMEGDPDTEIGRANVDLLGQMVGMPKPMGAAGVFGGRLSKTANLDLLAKAEQMAAEGAEAKSIWAQTGWFRGPEGKWRYEIPDVNAKLTPPAPVEQRESAAGIRPASTARERFGPLEQVIEHPEFHEAYPQLSKTTVDLTTSGSTPDTSYLSGYYAPAGRETPAHISLTAGSEETARSGLLHEMQHGVQEIEGFAPGADPRSLRPASPQQIRGLAQRTFQARGGDWSALTPAERKEVEKQVRFRVYEKHAGETEARNVQARRDQEHLGPPWLSEDIPREQQIIPRPLSPMLGTKLSRPFTPGRQALEQPPTAGLVQMPAIHPSEFERPLFDYSRLEEVPNRPQFPLPRIIPARGIPKHIEALSTPENMARTNAIVQMGMAHGGPKWYNTMPLLERYVGELGSTLGPPSWESHLKYVGATSPRSPVPANAGVASYYDMLAAQGRPFPEPVFREGNWSMPPGTLPEGYGQLAQATNALNAQMIREHGGWPAWSFFDKPKPPSFTSNLMGNYWPITSDVHNVSMLDLRGPRGNRLIMPPHPYYGFIENLQQGPMGAQHFGIAPAQYQASGWIPWAAGYRNVGRHGEVTGGSPKKLEQYSQPYIKVVENRVKEKARELGETPERTLRRFLRKEIAITGVPAAAIPLLQDRLQHAGQEGS